MADAVILSGKVDLKVQFTSATALSKLGEAMDMHDIEQRAFWHNVPGDRYGGPQGPPIEVQYLGEIVVVRTELSRWDTAVMDELRKRKVQTGTLGVVPLTDVGKLMLTSNMFRLCLDCSRPINFPCTILRDAIPFGMGSKFTSWGLQFECHRMPETVALWAAEGVLYDSNVTEY